MKSKVKLLSFALGTLFVLGLPIASVLKPVFSPQTPAAKNPDAPLVAVASQSNLEKIYQDWQSRYVGNGGDRNVVLGLGFARGLSKEFSTALGRVEIDMIEGSVSAEVAGLDRIAADVWLVDNQEGPGRSVLPEAGDHMVRIGRLQTAGERTAVTASLGREFFRDFELDLVVVTRTGQSPPQSRILLGSRSAFERNFTRARIAQEREERSKFDLLLSALGPRQAEANRILLAHNMVSQQMADGAELFFRGTFAGNGRTCATCHGVNDNQHLDQEIIAGLPVTDPLFIAEKPAIEGGVPGLERPALMRSFGLILENVDGAENPTVKFTMRGVPHSLSMATSILAPADGRAAHERVGWSGDGAPAPVTLRLFSAGAVFQHFTKSLARTPGVDFRLPSDPELDAMEVFMLSCGRLNELNLSLTTLSEPRAEAGRLTFMGAGKCNGCHGNAGANSLFTSANSNFDTGVERVPNPARTVESFPFDGGFGATAPFDSDGNGVADSFGDGTFNTTPLIEAADTPPFFHNNISLTLEEAVAFYSGPHFNASPAGVLVGGIALTRQQSSEVADFLRVVNAAFNLSISLQRIDAAMVLLQATNPEPPLDAQERRRTVSALIALSNQECLDAIDVLEAKGLNSSTVGPVREAVRLQRLALLTFPPKDRFQLLEDATLLITEGHDKLGDNLKFVMGEGNLLF